jgi:hypothetical protein
LIERGLFAKEVELLYGHNRDEASIFLLFGFPLLLTHSLAKGFIVSALGSTELADKMWAHYVEGVPLEALPAAAAAAGSAAAQTPPDAAAAQDGAVTLVATAAPSTAASAGSASLRSRVVQLLNDFWGCASFSFAAHAARHGARVHQYVFAHVPSYLTSHFEWLGAYHGKSLEAPKGRALADEG